LLLRVASYCADYGVLRPGYLALDRFPLVLEFSGINLLFASGVLVTTGLLQVSGTSQIADGLNGSAFDGVKLASAYARQIIRPCGSRQR